MRTIAIPAPAASAGTYDAVMRWLEEFLAHLEHARGVSRHTLRAYRADLGMCVDCWAAHQGGGKSIEQAVEDGSLVEWLEAGEE